MNELYPSFRKIAIHDQKILKEERHQKRLLGFLRGVGLKEKIQEAWGKCKSEVEMWDKYEEIAM